MAKRLVSFILENPWQWPGGWAFTAKLDTEDAEIVRGIEGIDHLFELRPGSYHCYVDPRYDYEAVWLEVYEALTDAARFQETYGDALAGLPDLP